MPDIRTFGRFWYCEACGKQNSRLDGECQWCECPGSDAECKRGTCSGPHAEWSMDAAGR